MKKLALLVSIVFILGCATFPPPAVGKSKKKAEPVTQSYQVGDQLQIQVAKGQFLDVVVVDIYTQSSAATGEISTFYRLKEEKYYTLPEGDPRLRVKPAGPRK